uniref:Uncharacterized protein n=1 Tax=Arundo donax TaxID=35708 RepID=A0A0A9FRC1_ARUDO
MLLPHWSFRAPAFYGRIQGHAS